MPGRTYPFLEGRAYHLCDRGNNRQLVYRCDSDYRAFLKRLRDYLAWRLSGRAKLPVPGCRPTA